MPESLDVVSAVNLRLSELFAARGPQLIALSEDLGPLVAQLETFTEGGKRSRARFVAAGASVGEQSTALNRAVTSAATALELFHAAALIHDDLLDRSDTRRGLPSTHRAFETIHESSGWVGDRPHFGASAAILAGDLLLMWSDDLLAEALEELAPKHAAAVRAEYSRMRTEVTAGQYLDIVEELAWPVVTISDRAKRAVRIATSKSARYSVEAPMALGALLAGADPNTVAGLRRVGLPLGLAFQLRDDVLGVFGDSSVTGKPSGDDLREGKRTLIIAEVEVRASDSEREFFDHRLGQADLSADEIELMQHLIRTTGALDAVETQIEAWVEEGLTALESLDLAPEVTALMKTLADRSVRRDA